MKHNIDLEKLQAKLQTAKTADDLIGRDGILTDMFKGTLQAMLEGEAENHLGYPKGNRMLKTGSNKRNGSSKRSLRSSLGDMEIAVPRDREGSFEPLTLKKHQKSTSELEDKIISMYAKGMSVGDINEHLGDLYGIEASDTLISQITDKVWPMVEEWSQRVLEEVYPIVFIDAIHYKVREEGRIISKAAYIAIGYSTEGYKEVMGIWIGENESAKFWLTVLNQLQERGVKDILILSCDNLTGISEAIKAVFPDCIIQKCIVHQIRNTLKYLASKDQKAFIADLKTVYKAGSLESAEENLLKMEDQWGKAYPLVFKSWHSNWSELSAFFQFGPEIRKLIYTTNPIESFNRQLRKVTKSKSVFPSSKSLNKMLYLATGDITKKWNKPRQNWHRAIAELSIHFPNKIELKI